MTRRSLLVMVAFATCALAVRADMPQSQPGGQTFRTTADAVFVDVSVRRGGDAVTGLQAADFDLRDNGVKQKVESVEAGTIPIDLTLVVDVGRGGGRALTEPTGQIEAANMRDTAPFAEASALVNSEIRKVSAILRPGDRLRVFVADSYVHQVMPLQPVASVP